MSSSIRPTRIACGGSYELLASPWMSMAEPSVLRASGMSVSVRPGLASALRLMRPPRRNFTARAPDSASSFCRYSTRFLRKRSESMITGELKASRLRTGAAAARSRAAGSGSEPAAPGGPGFASAYAAVSPAAPPSAPLRKRRRPAFMVSPGGKLLGIADGSRPRQTLQPRHQRPSRAIPHRQAVIALQRHDGLRIPDPNARAIPGRKVGGPEVARLVVVTDRVAGGDDGGDISRAFRILGLSQERAARGIECVAPADDRRPVEGGHAIACVEVAPELHRLAVTALQFEGMQRGIHDPDQVVAPPIGFSRISKAFLAREGLPPCLDDEDPIVQAQALAIEGHETYGRELPALSCGPILRQQAVGVHGETLQRTQILFRGRPGRRTETTLPPGLQPHGTVIADGRAGAHR